MLKNKLHIVKQKNGIVFVEFPTYVYPNAKDIVSLCQIVNIFSHNLYLKLSGDVNCLKKFDKRYFNVVDINDNLVIDILTSELESLLNLVDFDKISVEMYPKDAFSSIDEIFHKRNYILKFYMYLIDNNGPFVLFDSNVFDYNNTINKIIEIMKMNNVLY